MALDQPVAETLQRQPMGFPVSQAPRHDEALRVVDPNNEVSGLSTRDDTRPLVVVFFEFLAQHLREVGDAQRVVVNRGAVATSPLHRSDGVKVLVIDERRITKLR